MNAFAWLDSTFSLRLIMTLLHFLWQGCAIGVLVVVGGTALRKAPAQWRYVFDVAALLLMAACLPATFVLTQVEVSQETVFDGADERPKLTARAGSLSVEKRGPAGLGGDGSERRAEGNAIASGAAAWDAKAGTRGHATGGALSAMLRAAAPWLSGLYLLCVVGMLARLAAGLWGGRRLLQTATVVVDDRFLAPIRRQARQMGLRRAPLVAYCEQILIPVVMGIFEPVVLLPAALSSGLSPDQLQALITHELAHIRRCDLLVNLVQRVIESVLFFHPVVWLVSRRVSLERENAADDLVLAAGWRRCHYADALIRMAELASAMGGPGPFHRAAVLAAGGGGASQFKSRILRLLHGADAAPLRLTRSGAGMLTVILVLSVAAPVLMHTLAQPPANRARLQGKEDSDHGPQRLEAIDKSQLPNVSENFRHRTTVLGRLVNGGGVIERIERDEIQFRSGDRIQLGAGSTVLVPHAAGDAPRTVRPAVLEPGMVLSYSMRDGEIVKLVLIGIVAEATPGESAFDRIAELELRRLSQIDDELDVRHPIRLAGKEGEASIEAGETKLIELPGPTRSVEWRAGDFRPESIEDIERFDYLLVQWRPNGRITWTCYRSPDVDDAKPSPRAHRNPDKDSPAAAHRRQLQRIQDIEAAAEEKPAQSRAAALRRAAAGYEAFYQRSRSQLAGVYARFYQARCLQKLGEKDDAEAILQQLLSLPDDAEAIEQLKALVRRQLSQKQSPDEGTPASDSGAAGATIRQQGGQSRSGLGGSPSGLIRVAGVCRDEAGAPLAGVTVNVLRQVYRPGASNPRVETFGMTKTEADGSFTAGDITAIWNQDPRSNYILYFTRADRPTRSLLVDEDVARPSALSSTLPSEGASEPYVPPFHVVVRFENGVTVMQGRDGASGFFTRAATDGETGSRGSRAP